MTTMFAIGTLADDLGHAVSDDGTVSTYPVSDYGDVAIAIPVDCRHDGIERGRVVHLRRRQRDLVAVAELHSAPPWALDGPVYWSPSLGRNNDGSLRLLGLSITPSPATVGLTPLRFTSTLDRHDPVQAGAIEECRRRTEGERRGFDLPLRITGDPEIEHRHHRPVVTY